LLQKKADLEKEKKSLEEAAQEKEALLHKKLKMIGNYVHDSVPFSDNEVRSWRKLVSWILLTVIAGQ
jgi:seryl-tRNA synthetase